MKIEPVLKGLLTFIPGVRRVVLKKGTGGTNSASYCYGVWLKHLTLLWENGLTEIPNTLAELGPGDSLGIGLAGVLSGVKTYYALDVVEHSNIDSNLQIFDELVELFKSRAARPTKGWPDFDNYLDATLFPNHILTEDLLKKSLDQKRIDAIRRAIKFPHLKHDLVTIKYIVPWSDKSVIRENSVDVILSHSVLEHVTDIDRTYQSLNAWLKYQGMMSHQIDFQSHGVSDIWNGYRSYSETMWKVILGKHPFLINRQPYSAHIKIIKKAGFRVVCDLKRHREDGIKRSELSTYWKNISNEDLNCSGALIQAEKNS